jgi:hypothetical protein
LCSHDRTVPPPHFPASCLPHAHLVSKCVWQSGEDHHFHSYFNDCIRENHGWTTFARYRLLARLAHTPALSSAAPTHLLARSYVYLATQASTSDRERHATTQVSTSSGASITVVPTTVDERDGVPAQVEDFAKKGYIIYRGWATPAETAAATIEALTTAMIKPKGVLVSGSHMQHSSIPAVD